MKQLSFKGLLAMAVICGASITAVAQPEAKDKVIKKEIKEKQQIIITRSGDKEEKMVIEIDGDKVKVNGKDVADIKDINVHVNNLKIPNVRVYSPGQGGFGFSWNDDHNSLYSVDSNRAMLGVMTESADNGVRLSSITKGSAAEKAGLKKGDVITKINNRNIQEPGDVTDAVHSHKPGDKVAVTYLRDGKEQKATAELDRWKGIDVAGFSTADRWNSAAWGNGQTAQVYRDSFARRRMAEGGDSAFRAFGRAYRRPSGSQLFSLSPSRPKLGMSVQDTDDGKGVKVLNIDEDGNAAKAGVKEEDVILQVDDIAVNSADELAAQMKAKKDQPSVKFQVQRNGKTQTIEVRTPKKLKTVDL